MTRRLLVLAVGVAGCNQAFGLDETRLDRDAAAPTECPPLGTAPKFGRAIRQAVQQDCLSYHFNSDGTLVTALCTEGTSKRMISVGRRDALLVADLDFAAPSGAMISAPRPAPLGRRIYVHHRVTATNETTIATYEETSVDTWSLTGSLPVPYASDHHFSTVFRGPTGDRLIVFDSDPETPVFEYEEEAGTWVRRGDARPRIPMFGGVEPLSLTSDGLRATFRGGTQLLYVDRPDLDSWFGAPLVIDDAPIVSDTQLTDDCTRLYYSGLDSVFYSQQR